MLSASRWTYASQQDYDAMAGEPTATSAWSAEDFAAMGAFMESFTKDLAESGELVESRGLAAPVHTRRVRLHNGVPVVTDRPYAEPNEVLAGYWIVECDGREEYKRHKCRHHVAQWQAQIR
jgi:hypothetical protein